MWNFVEGERGRLDVEPAGHFSDDKLLGIQDWLQGDIQNSLRAVEHFREDWDRVRRGEYEGTSGNVTYQELVGDEVRFESLYERWDDFVMPLAEMFEILDRYEEFLKARAARRRQAADGPGDRHRSSPASSRPPQASDGRYRFQVPDSGGRS